MITVSTTVTLMATTIEVIRADSFIPRTRMPVRTITRAKARMSKPNSPAPSLLPSAAGISQPALSMSDWT